MPQLQYMMKIQDEVASLLLLYTSGSPTWAVFCPLSHISGELLLILQVSAPAILSEMSSLNPQTDKLSLSWSDIYIYISQEDSWHKDAYVSE